MIWRGITRRNNMKAASQKTPRNSLGECPTNRCEQILLHLANIPDVPLPGTVVSDRTRHVASIAYLKKHYSKVFESCTEADMFALRHLLREAWTASDLRRKGWFVFLFRKFHADAVKRMEALRDRDGSSLVQHWRGRAEQMDWILKNSQQSRFTKGELIYNFVDSEQVGAAYVEETPPASYFDDCAFYLQRNLHRACRCRNVECSIPFFFKKKRAQRFCSTECAIKTELERKRTWWNENRAKPKRRK